MRHNVDLRPLIGLHAIYVGASTSELYPEHVGCACTIVAVSEVSDLCPLIVDFGMERGIAEPEWLIEA